MLKRICASLIVITLSTSLPQATFANDSEAEFALGGLTLLQSKYISMDSEDLFISAELVKVSYKFTNNSDKDIKTTVSFPLPAIPYDFTDQYYEDLNLPNYDDLNFKTLVDGKAISYRKIVTAELDGKDITEVLKKYKLPIDWVALVGTGKDWSDSVSVEQMDDLKKQGLLKEYDDGTFAPTWSARTSIVREQVFPAHKTISVVHSYRPLAGGSVGGALSELDENQELAKEYETKYCTDKSFLNGFKKAEAAAIAKEQYYSETWLGYVLKSGANWQGPIKDFHLTIDKGSPKNLVSFCMDGVKKTSPTKFEVFKKDFEPTQDLDILIVNF